MVRTREDATVAARSLCRYWGLPGEHLARLPSGTNDVYRVGGTAFLIRVAPPGWSLHRVATQVRIAKALNDEGVAFSEPAAAAVELPAGAGTVVGSLWLWLEPEPGAPLLWGELGHLLQDLHHAGSRLDTAGMEVPPKDFLLHVEQRLFADHPLAGAPDEDIALLRQWYEQLKHEYEDLQYVLDSGLIHGDVRPANIVVTSSGPALIDADSLSCGPRELDLLWTVEQYRRELLDDQNYQAFTRGYGADLAGWSGVLTLVRLRELSQTTWALLRRFTSGRDSKDSQRLLEWWRQGAPLRDVP